MDHSWRIRKISELAKDCEVAVCQRVVIAQRANAKVSETPESYFNAAVTKLIFLTLNLRCTSRKLSHNDTTEIDGRYS